LTTIRTGAIEDAPAIWAVLKPVFRAGDTYTVPADISQQDALAFWMKGNHTSYVAVDGADILGTYYICPNQQGGGSHVCNCGFATSPAARGRGIARKMLAHALATAREMGFKAMQFNFVVASNETAIRIWHENGFATVGRLPGVFKHPDLGYVDALVMHRHL